MLQQKKNPWHIAHVGSAHERRAPAAAPVARLRRPQLRVRPKGARARRQLRHLRAVAALRQARAHAQQALPGCSAARGHVALLRVKRARGRRVVAGWSILTRHIDATILHCDQSPSGQWRRHWRPESPETLSVQLRVLQCTATATTDCPPSGIEAMAATATCRQSAER